jgi:hypothetical protein
MKLSRGQCWPVWENINLWGFNWGNWGLVQKVETLILGTLGNMVSESCQKKSVLLWDIVFLSLISKWVNVGRVFVGISVGVLFRKLKPLSRELRGMRCSWEYHILSSLLNFWGTCWKCIYEVVVEDLIKCKTKMTNWDSLERFDPTISTKHHEVENRFNKKNKIHSQSAEMNHNKCYGLGEG